VHYEIRVGSGVHGGEGLLPECFLYGRLVLAGWLLFLAAETRSQILGSWAKLDIDVNFYFMSCIVQRFSSVFKSK
jgi:hypothetical protein